MSENNQSVETEKPKVLVIVGPTASGKSALAIALAERFDGEVVSADSRQVYRGLDIGTGKVTKEEIAGIPHHLLDIADPKETYTVVDFVRDASRTIGDIQTRGRLPIVVGGTFFYIDSLLNESPLPEVPPNKELRAQLENLDEETLFGALLRLDPRRAKEIDSKNKRRLIRALEIIKAIGTVPKLAERPRYRTLTLGIETEVSQLREAIHKRLSERMGLGMVKEAERLYSEGLTLERMDELGLEYRYLAKLLSGEMDEETMQKVLETEIWHYAKRQRTWLRRKKDIVWVKRDEQDVAAKLVEKFLNRV